MESTNTVLTPKILSMNSDQSPDTSDSSDMPTDLPEPATDAEPATGAAVPPSSPYPKGWPFNRNWTPEDLRRLEHTARSADLTGWLNRQAKEPGELYVPPVYTCQECASRVRCDFVFDSYNTHGDCIAEK